MNEIIIIILIIIAGIVTALFFVRFVDMVYMAGWKKGFYEGKQTAINEREQTIWKTNDNYNGIW